MHVRALRGLSEIRLSCLNGHHRVQISIQLSIYGLIWRNMSALASAIQLLSSRRWFSKNGRKYHLLYAND